MRASSPRYPKALSVLIVCNACFPARCISAEMFSVCNSRVLESTRYKQWVYVHISIAGFQPVPLLFICEPFCMKLSAHPFA